MRAPVPPPAPEPRFRALIDRLGAVVYEAVVGETPGDVHFIFVSGGAEGLLGYPVSRWHEDPRFWIELIHPQDRPAVLAATYRAVERMRPDELEYRHVTAAGQDLWVRNVVYPERLPDGSARVSGVMIDISHSRHAEDRLERMHLASARLRAGMTQTEAAQTLAEIGRAAVGGLAVAVFVRRGEELAPLGYDGPGRLDATAEFTVPVAAEAPVARAARSGEVVLVDAEEATRDLPPGGMALLAGDGPLAALPLPDGTGAPLGALAVRMAAGTAVERADLTLLEVLARTAGATLERGAVLDAERAARHSAEEANVLLDTLITTAPEGYALFDTDLRFARVNEALAEMNGVPAAEHLGRSVAEVLPGVPIADLLARVRDTGEALVELEVAGVDRRGREHVWLASYYPVFGAGGEVAWVGAVVVDITRRKRAEQHVAQLARLGEILEEAGNVEDRLTRVADALTGSFCDFTTLYLRRPGDRLERVVTRHVDPEHEQAIAANPPSDGALLLAGPLRWDDMAAGDYDAIGADPVARDSHRRIGTRSVLTTPLLLRGENLGVLGVGSSRVAAFDEADERFMADVARRVALTVDNARLQDAEREARDRTEGQYAIAAALADALTPDDVAAALLGELLPALDADVGVVWRVVEDGTTHLEMIGARVDAQTRRQIPDRRTLSDDYQLSQVLHDRRARWSAGADETSAAFPACASELAERGLQATGMLPLLAAGRPVGALFVAARRASFSGEDHALALTATAQAAQALERATLYDTARRTSVTLQRSLLPPALPAVPGAQVGLRYLPAAGLEAGGDFYEALPVGADGALLVAVGDVVGRGAAAAAAMGQLRSALRAFAQVLEEPGPVLARLSAFADEVGGAMAATAVVASLLPSTGELRYACAGHPWPLLVGADGEARFLQGGRGVPLGCVERPVYEAATTYLRPGETLLLYTDGLTERRGVDLPLAMERLRTAAAAAAAGDLDAMVDRVLAEMGEEAGDDVALVAVRLAGAPTDRHLRFDAVLAEVPAARTAVRTWLAELGVTGDAANDVLLAAGEAFANAVEHSGAVEVRLSLTSPGRGEVAVQVEDAGAWRPPPEVTLRGRGLTMMRALVDEFAIEPSPTGTRVRLRHGVGAAPAGAPALAATAAGPSGCEVTLVDGVARLRGALDMASAAAVGARLHPLTADGLVVDLTRVDFLDSSGARLLLELSEAGSVEIVAPAGGPSRRTLALSGLDRVLPLRD